MTLGTTMDGVHSVARLPSWIGVAAVRIDMRLPRTVTALTGDARFDSALVDETILRGEVVRMASETTHGFGSIMQHSQFAEVALGRVYGLPRSHIDRISVVPRPTEFQLIGRTRTIQHGARPSAGVIARTEAPAQRNLG